MSHRFSVVFLGIVFLSLNIFAYKEDEWYCKNNKDYQICRRCHDLNAPCPREEFDNKCTCDHIGLLDPKEGNFKGASNCLTTDDYDTSYCFVDEDSPCEDLEEDVFANEIAKKTELFYPSSTIYYSEEACEEEQTQTGNQAYLHGVMITKDFLVRADTKKNFTIQFDYPDNYDDYDDYQEIDVGWEQCAKQCVASNKKTGVCGAWSFDNIEGICYLHTIDACCGQVQKQTKDPGFTSGYVCPHCWSTYNDCPCTVKERQSCSTCTLHTVGGAASDPTHTSATGALEVHGIKLNVDVCECRRYWRRRRKTWGCRKQCCAEEGDETGCKDKKRCRKCKKKQN